MALAERRWYRELAETAQRLADRSKLGLESGFSLAKAALAWRMLVDAGAPVQAERWSERWALARAWGGELFTSAAQADSQIDLCAALLDSLAACQAPVPMEQSLAFIHQLALDHQGEGRLRLRRSTGSYYTPPIIVDHLLADSLERWIDHWRKRWLTADPEQLQSLRSELDALRVLDPACGAGAFLLAAWERLIPCWQMIGETCPARAALRNISGWEQAHGAVEILKVTVAARLCQAGEPSPDLSLQITIGDYLQHLPTTDEQVAIIVGNPPWVRAKYAVTGTDLERRSQLASLRRQFPDLAVGELNLYTLFISRALDWLRPGGRLAFITPSSFLLDRNSEGLRRRLLDSCRIHEIVPLSERDGRQLFGGVCQASALLTVEKIDGSAQDDLYERQQHWLALPQALMVMGSEVEMRLLRRLLSYPTLAEPYLIQDGELHLTRGREWLSDRDGEGLLPLMRGDDLSRYPAKGRTYVRLSDSLRERWQGLIAGRRILLQRIANQHLRRRLKGAIVQGVVAANSTVALIPRDDSAALLLPATLKLLHSNLYHWLLTKLSSDNNIPAWKLKMLPWLPPAGLRMEIDSAETNQCVYDLYQLTSEEQLIVEGAVGTAKNHAD